MLVVNQVEMHCFASNCYIISGQNGDAVLIDPGMEPESIIGKMKELKVVPKAVLLTHAHYDHFCAYPELKKKFPELKLYISGKDKSLLEDAKKNYSATAVGKEVVLVADELVDDQSVIREAGLEFNVLATPGHTAGCVCYICDDCIFTGDTLFVQGCGRTDMYSSDFMDMVDSLSKLRNIKTNYRMYPGHDSTGMLFDQYDWIDDIVERIKKAW